MQGQRVDKLSAGKPEGESGAGPPENACIDSNSFNIDTLNYIQSAKARIWTFALAELVALFSTVFVFAWWRIPNLFGAMTASLESIRFISDIVIACVILTVFSILPIFWLRVFWRREKSVRAAALRWIEDGRIMEFQRCIIRELLATISPEIRRSIIDRQGGDSETKEINLLLYLVKAGNSSLEKEPIFEENAKRIRALLSSVPQLTSLFHAHLGTTVGVTETAAFAIMRQLGEVKAAAEGLVGKLGSSNAKAQAMENTVQEAIAESHDLIASINAYHRERTRQVKEDVAGIESIALQIEELKSMTGMIRDITSQTNVLAINAAIEAARAGQAGRGFTIVASEVRKLSRQIEEVTIKIEDSIGKVSSTTKTKLSSIVAQTRIEVEEKQLASMDSSLPRLSGYYMDAVLELEELSRRTQDSVQLIRGSVMDILAHAQFQDITRQQIEQVQKGILILGERMKELGEIMEHDLSQPLDIKPFQEIADSMKSNYTMMVQRKIHHKTLGGALPEAEEKQPSIELF